MLYLRRCGDDGDSFMTVSGNASLAGAVSADKRRLDRARRRCCKEEEEEATVVVVEESAIVGKGVARVLTTVGAHRQVEES